MLLGAECRLRDRVLDRGRDGDLVGPRGNPVATWSVGDSPVYRPPEPRLRPVQRRRRRRRPVPHPPGVHARRHGPGAVPRSTSSTPGWTARTRPGSSGKAAALERQRLGRRGRPQTANDSRFVCRDELRYSLRVAALLRPLGAPDLPGHRRPGAGLAGHRPPAGDRGRTTGRSSATPGGCPRSTRRPSSPGCTASRAWPSTSSTSTTTCSSGRPMTPDDVLHPRRADPVLPVRRAGRPGAARRRTTRR